MQRKEHINPVGSGIGNREDMLCIIARGGSNLTISLKGQAGKKGISSTENTFCGGSRALPSCWLLV